MDDSFLSTILRVEEPDPKKERILVVPFQRVGRCVMFLDMRPLWCVARLSQPFTTVGGSLLFLSNTFTQWAVMQLASRRGPRRTTAQASEWS